jgi:hypothetical protein
MPNTISPRSMPEFWGNMATPPTKRRSSSSKKSSKSLSGYYSVRSSNKSKTRKLRQMNAEISEILEDYKVPDLRKRKDIWETFPVFLKKLPTSDGVDRYEVLWHNTNLRDWQKSKPDSWDEYMEYPRWCEVRLRYALKKHPRQYKLLKPRDPSQLMIIEMVFKPKH